MSDEPNMHNVPVYPGGRPIDPKPLLAAIGDDLRVMVRQELEAAITTHLAPVLRPTVILEQPTRPEASSADGGTVVIEFGQATTYAESSVSPMRIAGVDANAAVDPQAGNGMPAPEAVGRYILDRLSMLEAYKRNADRELERLRKLNAELLALSVSSEATEVDGDAFLRWLRGEAPPVQQNAALDHRIVEGTMDGRELRLGSPPNAKWVPLPDALAHWLNDGDRARVTVERLSAQSDLVPCPACRLTGSHKLQCPRREERQVVLPAEETGEGSESR